MRGKRNNPPPVVEVKPPPAPEPTAPGATAVKLIECIHPTGSTMSIKWTNSPHCFLVMTDIGVKCITPSVVFMVPFTNIKYIELW